jgi:hypothetical protein
MPASTIGWRQRRGVIGPNKLTQSAPSSGLGGASKTGLPNYSRAIAMPALSVDHCDYGGLVRTD